MSTTVTVLGRKNWIVEYKGFYLQSVGTVPAYVINEEVVWLFLNSNQVYAELGTCCFFSRLALLSIFTHGSLLLYRSFCGFSGLLIAQLLLKNQWFALGKER